MFPRFKRLTWKAALLASVLSLLFTVALAASGDLDTTFSGDGKVTSFAVPSNPGRSDTAWGVAIQPADGKIVVAGDSRISSKGINDFVVLRYQPDGTLDTTFSGDGRQLTNFGGYDQALDVALQSDGKFVAAGQTCNADSSICDVALARYKPGGSLDTTFSGDGKQTDDFGGGDNGSLGGVAIQPDGKIVVAGYMDNGANYDFAVYRYLSNGSLDTTFSGDGMAQIGFGAGRQDLAQELVIQSDGKIVVVGYTGDANEHNNNFALVRLKPNGSLDPAFNGGGKQVTNFGGEDYGNGIALQADGKIVVAGSKNTSTLSSFALARYNVDGSLDTTFNFSGKKVFNFSANRNSGASTVLIQPDGKIVALGYAFNGTDNDFALVRFKSGGGFDTTFSSDGRVVVNFGGIDGGLALAIQPVDGKYVLSGRTDDGTQLDLAVARVLP